jgi:hypothetical protein
MALRALFGACLLASACGEYFAEVRSRAAFDFSCPEDRLELTEIAKNTVAVEGCRRRGTYVRQCHGYDCVWLYSSPPPLAGNRTPSAD